MSTIKIGDCRGIVEAVNEACTCGGAGPGEGCPACEVFHAIKDMEFDDGKAATPEQPWDIDMAVRSWWHGAQDDGSSPPLSVRALENLVDYLAKSRSRFIPPPPAVPPQEQEGRSLPGLHESVKVIDDDGKWFTATVITPVTFQASDGTHEYTLRMDEEGEQWKPIIVERVDKGGK